MTEHVEVRAGPAVAYVKGALQQLETADLLEPQRAQRPNGALKLIVGGSVRRDGATDRKGGPSGLQCGPGLRKIQDDSVKTRFVESIHGHVSLHEADPTGEAGLRDITPSHF